MTTSTTSDTLHETAQRFDAQIRQNRLLQTHAPWDDELIYPAYVHKLTLRNVAQTVAALLGVSLPSAAPLPDAVWGADTPPDVDRVVLFVMDGLGYDYLQRVRTSQPAIDRAITALTDGRGPLPLTSVAPSTTAVALTTLHTGHAPAAHGMLGSAMALRDYSTVGSMLSYRPYVGKHSRDAFYEWGLTADDFVRTNGLAEYLAVAGIPTHILLQGNLLGSGLSNILHRGVPRENWHSHSGYADFALRVRDVLRQTAGQRCYVNLYWAGIDTLSHRYGADSEYVRLELETQLSALAGLLDDPTLQDGRTLFMLLADHGHADAPNQINLRNDPQTQAIYTALAFGITGDARLPILHVRDGQRDVIKAAIDSHYADVLTYVDSATALQSGLYGDRAETANVDQQTHHRIGEMLLLPRAGTTVQDPSTTLFQLTSWHGGLSSAEMRVPFLWKRL